MRLHLLLPVRALVRRVWEDRRMLQRSQGGFSGHVSPYRVSADEIAYSEVCDSGHDSSIKT